MDSSLTREDFLGADDLNVWKQLAQNDPASPALLPLARTYLFREEPVRALEISQRIFAAHPYHMEAAMLTARSLLDLGRADEARELLARAELNLDDIADHLEEVGRLLAAVGDTASASRAAEAVEALRKSGPVEPPRAEPLEAESDSAEVSEAIPTETMAALYLGQGHIDKAVEIYRLLVEQNPQNERLVQKLNELRLMADFPDDAPDKPVDSEWDGVVHPEPVTATDIVAPPPGLFAGPGSGDDVPETEPPTEDDFGSDDFGEAFDEDWDEFELPPLERVDAVDERVGLVDEAEEDTGWEDLIPTTVDPSDTLHRYDTESDPVEVAAWTDLVPDTLEEPEERGPVAAGVYETFPDLAADAEESADDLEAMLESGLPEMPDPEQAAPEAAAKDAGFEPPDGVPDETTPAEPTEDWHDLASTSFQIVPPDERTEDETPEASGAELTVDTAEPEPEPPSPKVIGKKKLAGKLRRLHQAARKRREAVDVTPTQ